MRSPLAPLLRSVRLPSRQRWPTLPSTALGRLRALTFALALLSLLGPLAVGLVTEGEPLLTRLGALAAGVGTVVLWAAGFRAKRFAAGSELLEAAGVGLALGFLTSGAAVAPLFAVVFRSLYGTVVEAVVRFVLYAAVATLLVETVDSTLIGQLMGLALATSFMHFLYRSLLRQEREEEAFRLLEGAKDHAVFLLDAAGRVRSWNEGAARMLGYTEQEIIGKPLAELDAEGQGAAERQLTRAAELGSVEVAGWRTRADGSPLFAEAVLTARRDERRDLVGYSLILRDVSERLKDQEALVESEERLQRVVGGAPVVMWALDEEGTIILCEGGMLGALGIDGEQLIGTPISQLDCADRQFVTDNLRALRGEAFVAHTEYRGRSFQLRYAPTLEVGGAIGVATDVTATEIAERLQRSLLPRALPDIPQFAMAARYIPGSPGSDVGGDWYDVIPLPGGRIGLMAGDVAGRGLEAATLMGQLRNAVLISALEQDRPAEVLASVNRTMQHFAGGQMATALYGILDPLDSTLRLANAGHLPPLILGADGGARFAGGRSGSPPLGALPATRYDERRSEVAPGELVLLYTDGLVERPGESLLGRLEELRDAALRGPPDPGPLCDHLVEAMIGAARRADDVALLAVRNELVEEGPLRLELPARPESLGQVRRQLGRWLVQRGVADRELQRLLVAVGEACTNVVEHAYGPESGPLCLDATVESGWLVVAVRDHGRWRQPRPSGRGRGRTMMERLVDEVTISQGDEGTTVELRVRTAPVTA